MAKNSVIVQVDCDLNDSVKGLIEWWECTEMLLKVLRRLGTEIVDEEVSRYVAEIADELEREIKQAQDKIALESALSIREQG